MSTAPRDLTTAERARLFSGRDYWSTHELPERQITAVTMADGPHGLRHQGEEVDHLGLHASVPATCFPPAVAVGSSWDPAVAEQVGAGIAREARAQGVDVVLGPGINIKRSPLCGRNFEYYSEDPLLSGVLGTAHVTGQQREGVGASVKHFAANNQEADRMRVSSEVDERTLREIYLPAFERVISRAQPATVMCAYNKINGVYASENRWLLTEVLREQWGFKGLVVSDWGAVHDPVAAIQAGVDLEMPSTGGRSAAVLERAVNDGRLDPDVLAASTDRVLRLPRAERDVPPDPDTQHALARSLAAQCAVLLKNDGALPLTATARLAVIGELATTPRFQAGGSSKVNTTRVESFGDALAERGIQAAIEPGYHLDGSGDAKSLRAAAVAATADADIAVVFLGLGEREESEGFDRATLALPHDQVTLVRSVAATGTPTVVVLSHGGVVTVEDWHDDVAAILDAFLLGQATGPAVADLLFGDVNPSGRLAETIPRRLEDTPSYGNFPGEQGHVVYGERVLVGYRGHVTTGAPVRYPFGYGLSYTTFTTSDVEVVATGSSIAAVRATVTNTGERDGGHVVQVYVDATGAGSPVLRPRRELRAFTKVHLRAGASARVEMKLDRRAFAYWDVELSDWVVTPGAYRVELCRDSETVEHSQTIDLTGDEVARPLTLWSTLQEWLDHPIVGPTLLDEIGSERLRAFTVPDVLRLIGTLPMQKIVNQLGSSAPEGLFEQLMVRSAGVGR